MKTWIVKPATLRQLAELYEIPYRIFKTHVNEFKQKLGKRVGHYYSVKQVLTIFEEYGEPGNVIIVYPPKQKN